MCFFTYCLLKFKPFLINFPIQYFLVRKSGKIYFIDHNQQHIDKKSQINIMGYQNSIQYSQLPTGIIILPIISIGKVVHVFSSSTS